MVIKGKIVPMISSQMKNEGWLYWLAFLIALALRLIQLGASPLNDSEAVLALQSLAIARGESPILSPQPAYILLTSIPFAIIESTNFLARILPAMAGSLFVFAPVFFRDRLKPHAALILAFLFAFDPGLVALSRQAHGTILAVTFLFLAWGMWKQGRLIPAGVSGALALLSGPSIWSGLLILGLTWLFLKRTVSKQTEDQSPVSGLDVPVSPARPSTTPDSPILYSKISTHPSSVTDRKSSLIDIRPPVLSLLVTLLLGGTLFFIVPNGLSAWLASIPTYFSGWVHATETTPARILLTFFAYEPLGLLLAGLALVRGVRTKSRRITRLAVWIGVSLLLAVFYRQPSELAWVILPLLVLAALELSHALDVRRGERMEAGLVALAAVILLVFVWFNIAGIALNPYSQPVTSLPLFGEVQNPRTLVLIGSFALIVVFVALVAFGWSARIARIGATWSFAACIGMYSLGAAWGTSGLRNPGGVELWSADPKPLQADLLLASIRDVSEFSLGHALSQPVTLAGIDSPALEWILRDRPVEKVSALDPQLAPPILITQVMDNPGLPSAYRGQDFTWRQRPQWEILQSGDWLKWILFRQLPLENETIILWARDDLFPDAREGAPP
jgi:hypothetical protein